MIVKGKIAYLAAHESPIPLTIISTALARFVSVDWYS
jgi:hypothetical protein